MACPVSAPTRWKRSSAILAAMPHSIRVPRFPMAPGPRITDSWRAGALACIVALASHSALAQQPPPQNPQPQQPRKIVVLDRIVAVVNEDVVTRLDLDQRIRLVSAQMKQKGAPAPPRDVLEKQILERLV